MTRKINSFMMSLAINRLSKSINPDENQTGRVNKSIDEAAKAFFADAEKKQKELAEGHILMYAYDSKGDTSMISTNTIALYFEEISYTGGAHSNSSTSFFNFDANTGKLMALNDIV